MFCKYCGAEVGENAVVCVKCGAAVDGKNVTGDKNNSEWILVMLLCFFLGSFGVHRFYTGKIVTGILMLLTLGGCGIWALIDLIMILVGSFTDSDGKPIKNS